VVNLHKGSKQKTISRGQYNTHYNNDLCILSTLRIRIVSLVEGLLDFPVSTFDDIGYYIEECNKNRTMAVTKMNETSR